MEDNAKLATGFQAGHESAVLNIDVADTNTEVEDPAASKPLDAILLHFRLPNRDGAEVCRNVRRRKARRRC